MKGTTGRKKKKKGYARIPPEALELYWERIKRREMKDTEDNSTSGNGKGGRKKKEKV